MTQRALMGEFLGWSERQWARAAAGCPGHGTAGLALVGLQKDYRKRYRVEPTHDGDLQSEWFRQMSNGLRGLWSGKGSENEPAVAE
jgi:hypothetical protein